MVRPPAQAGGSHANHVHPMGWLSSAFYVVLPPDLGRDEAGLLTLGETASSTKAGCAAAPADPAEAGPTCLVSLLDVARHAAIWGG